MRAVAGAGRRGHEFKWAVSARGRSAGAIPVAVRDGSRWQSAHASHRLPTTQETLRVSLACKGALNGEHAMLRDSDVTGREGSGLFPGHVGRIRIAAQRGVSRTSMRYDASAHSYWRPIGAVNICSNGWKLGCSTRMRNEPVQPAKYVSGV